MARFLGTGDLETIDYNNDTNITDLDDVETINYNDNTNINDLDIVNVKKTSGAQLVAKTIVKKCRNQVKKKPYQRPPQNTFDDLADLEAIGYNNPTCISDLNDIAARSKKNSGTQVAAKNIIKNYRNLAKKKAQKNQTDLADAETIDYNKDTNVSDLNEPLSKKTSSAQIAAKKL